MKQKMITIILALSICFISFHAKSQYSWTLQAPLSAAKGNCTSSVLDGKIYVIGGVLAPNGQGITDVEVYDPVLDIWETNAADYPVPICGASASTVNGKIYVMGGHPSDAPVNAMASVYMYDPVDGSWTIKADMIKPRFYHVSVVVDDKIYVIGGRSEDYPGPIENTVEMYDPDSDTWVSMSSMQQERAVFTAEVLGNSIYVMGGGSPDASFNSVEVYDPQTNSWTQKNNLLTERALHGSGVLGGTIYVFGGGPSFTDPLSGTWKYDKDLDAWIDIDTDLPEPILGVFGHSVAEDENGEECLYALGGTFVDFWTGGDSPFVTNTNYKLCLITSTKNPKQKPAPVEQIHNYPNPFDARTKFGYELNNSGMVSFKIFNLDGKEIATLVEAFQLAGQHEIEWLAKGLPDGVYFYRLKTENFFETGKCIIQN